MPKQHPRSDDNFAALLTVCCLVTFACYFAAAMRLPIVPLYARSFGVSTAQIGVINSAFYLMAALLALPSGLLADLFGRKRLAVTGAIVMTICLALLYFSRSYGQLLGVYLLLGVGIAAFGPTMMSYVAEISPATHLGRAYGWYTTAIFCGLGLGPAVGGGLGDRFGFEMVFLVAAVCAVLATGALIRWVAFRTPSDQDTGQRGRLLAGLRRLIASRPLLGCWLTTFGACVSAGMFFTFLPLHADAQGLDVTQIGLVFLVHSAINASARIPFGYWSDKVANRKYFANAGIALMALSIAAFGPARQFWQFLLAALCTGTSLALTFTSIGALIAEAAPPGFRGLAMGGYNTCVFLGMMIGAVTLGPVIEMLGFRLSFVLTGLSNLVFVAIFYFLLRDFKPAAQ